MPFNRVFFCFAVSVEVFYTISENRGRALARILLPLLLTLTTLAGCNVSLPTEITSAQNFVCLSSANDFTACCLGRGGAQTCSAVEAGYYFRSSDKALVCGDGNVSTGCHQF